MFRREGYSEDNVDCRDIREVVGYIVRTENSGSVFGNKARDRVCSYCSKIGYEKNNCW